MRSSYWRWCSLILIIICFSFRFEEEPVLFIVDDAGINTAVNVDYLSDREEEMIKEINLLRKNPKFYSLLVLQELAKTKADSLRLSQMVSVTIRSKTTLYASGPVTVVDTQENSLYENKLTAIYDLLEDLKKVESLPLLFPNKNIQVAAVKHGIDQAPKGDVDHQGTDGSWPLDRMLREASYVKDGNENIAAGGCTPRAIILQLLIDSGVPGYGHRENLLNPNWEIIGCHELQKYEDGCGNYWIQEFAST